MTLTNVFYLSCDLISGHMAVMYMECFFFQAEDGIRDYKVTGVQTCALPICEIEAKVIKLNRKRSNIVLSRKAILEERDAGRKGETLNHIEEDIIVEGQIKNLTDRKSVV